MKWKKIIHCIWISILLTSCATPLVEKALDGKFSPSKNNKIINDYCTSCHEHNSFVPNDHLLAVATQYNKKIFKNTRECRTCHYLKKTLIFRDTIEKTNYPEKSNP